MSYLKTAKIHNQPSTDTSHFPSGNRAYIIGDDSECDDVFVTRTRALDMLHDCLFGIIVSFEPAGSLAACKQESPSEVIWLY
jgi:hypothetical protein